MPQYSNELIFTLAFILWSLAQFEHLLDLVFDSLALPHLRERNQRQVLLHLQELIDDVKLPHSSLVVMTPLQVLILLLHLLMSVVDVFLGVDDRREYPVLKELGQSSVNFGLGTVKKIDFVRSLKLKRGYLV